MKSLLLLLFAFFSFQSFAETIPALPAYAISQNGCTSRGVDIAAVCADWAATRPLPPCNSSTGYSATVHSVSGSSCTLDWMFNGSHISYPVWQALPSGYDCPDGYTLDAGGTTCTGQGARDCTALKNDSYSGYIPVGANPAAACENGCGISVVDATDQAAVGGQQVIAGTFSYTGDACTGNDVTPGTPPACPAGQCVGVINGSNSCFTCSDIGKSGKSYKKTSDDTVKITTYNPDGSSTESIHDIDTGTDSDPTTKEKTDMERYCEDHPESFSCMDSGDNPDVPEPTLGEVQSAAESFGLIKNFVQIQPSNFSHTSQCPTSSFSWNGQVYTFDAHCELITNHWTALASAMLAAWTVLSLFVVLRA